jgi:hypothetical protein
VIDLPNNALAPLLQFHTKCPVRTMLTTSHPAATGMCRGKDNHSPCRVDLRMVALGPARPC